MVHPSLIQLSPLDNIAIAVEALKQGDTSRNGIVAASDIPAGHKIALKVIRKGQTVIKSGQMIGEALQDIGAGDWVHSHNLGFVAGTDRLASRHEPPALPMALRRSFKGFRRANGQAGTRNYIGILASVNCSTTVCRSIAESAARVLLPQFPAIDGFVPITHALGCGASSSGLGQTILQRTLAGYARHPNFGAVLLVGLGCEVNQIMLYGKAGRDAPITSFNIQDAGGSRAAVMKALDILKDMAIEASKAVREDIPVAELTVGLQCGGSDGFSGLSANPALGAAMDRLVAAGGTAILSETPEIYGAEHLLTSRASPAVAQKLMERIHWWEDYAAKNGASLDNNPSPGNKRGGLTTILEKSLGAVAKAGRAPLSAVYDYAEKVTAKGLVYMDTPGYDPVSATGQVAGGANMIVFTTGRGSCFGCRPTPSIKVASNSALFASMGEDMDVNAGRIVEGTASIEAVGEEIYNLVLDVASGTKTLSEEFGYGDNEFVPWSMGAVL